MQKLLALGGTAFCVYVVVQLLRYRGSDNWPTTVATVEKIEVRRIQDSDSHHFRPVVSFSFVVSENYYSGEWQQNTPIGTKLSARYKPNDSKLNLLDIDPARTIRQVGLLRGELRNKSGRQKRRKFTR